MARYRLMLLDGVAAGHRGAADVIAMPPEGVDAAVLGRALGGPIAQPVMLAASDDAEALQRVLARLQGAGLEVCIFDDSTALIRLAETVRTALGFTLVKAVGTPVEGAVPPRLTGPMAPDQGAALIDPNDGRWRRMALLAAGLALPMIVTLFLSGAFDGALSGEEPTAAPSSAEASGGERSRRLAAHAGAGQGDAPGPGEAGARSGRGGAASSAASGGGGDSVEFTQDGADPSSSPAATAPPKRTARRAIAAVLALLLGLASAAVLGEAVERSTRTRSAATRRRIRRGVALAAGLGLAVAPVAVWQASAASPVPVALPPARSRPTPRPSPRLAEDARCPGGPFSRFVCRSVRGGRRSDARPFASLLTRFRRRSQPHPDAGTVAAIDAAVAPRERHASRHHRRHHERAPTVATSDAAVSDAVVAQAAPAPVAPVAPVDASVAPPTETSPETMVVAAPPPSEAIEPTVTGAPEAPALPAPPKPKGLPRGWFAGWFLAGLVAGLWATPGWRRLGRS